MISALVTLMVVLALIGLVVAFIVFVWATDGRWSTGGTGMVERWRLTGSPEDVFARRLHHATATIDTAVVEALDRPDLRWRLVETSGLIQHQLLVCSRLPAQSKRAVLHEVESMVVEFEAVCARLLLDAAEASSAVVRARLADIEASIDVLHEARNEIDRLGT